VALHDVEPATFEHCLKTRAWLAERGVDRVTLLVIPARDLHPVGERSPELTSWLAERRRAGDSIAQHGFQHAKLARAPFSRGELARAWASQRSAEFVGLDGEETRRALDAGWRILKLAGIEPDGFVAPAYAYTPALREALLGRFRWWAGMLQLHRAATSPPGAATYPPGAQESLRATGRQARPLLAPVWGVGTDGRLRRLLTPSLIRLGSAVCEGTLRLDLHPSDLAHPRPMRALESALGGVWRRREAVTYDQLVAGA
jgi:predicted deacetylase